MIKYLTACLLLISSSAFAQLTMEAGSEYEKAATCTAVACDEVDTEATDADAAYDADVAAKAALVAATADVAAKAKAVTTAETAEAALAATATDAEKNCCEGCSDYGESSFSYVDYG